jgi:hypothetical protein
MATNMSKWVVPAVGFVLGLLMAAALLGRHASLGQAAVAFVIVAGYAIALRVLQSRSDMASLLSGLPRDERWESINLRALSLAGQLIAVVLVGAFLVTQFSGGDSMPYAWVGAVFGVGYLGGLL